jgi:hypothetical protein
VCVDNIVLLLCENAQGNVPLEGRLAGREKGKLDKARQGCCCLLFKGRCILDKTRQDDRLSFGQAIVVVVLIKGFVVLTRGEQTVSEFVLANQITRHMFVICYVVYYISNLKNGG